MTAVHRRVNSANQGRIKRGEREEQIFGRGERVGREIKRGRGASLLSELRALGGVASILSLRSTTFVYVFDLDRGGGDELGLRGLHES
uniref:Uncharacterized protein n=1 Tax=Oryza glumipatula TaxID=40148 RepID=A0A0E0AJD3_9ORYZ